MRGCILFACLAVACLLVSAEGYQAQDYAANLDAAGVPAQQKSLPIHFHTLAGLNRIDLDDDAADDETYRAFQLARYTGDAAMQVRQHEEEFMRKRREEMRMSESELGQSNDVTPSVEERTTQPAPQQKVSREDEIMGDNSEVLLQVGEGEAAEKHEPFDAVHVAHSGDIEDSDTHFVMTDKIRHKELKDAVLMASEQPDERRAQKVAKKMERKAHEIEEQSLGESKPEPEWNKALARNHYRRNAAGWVVFGDGA